jgi:hypothetical protein
MAETLQIGPITVTEREGVSRAAADVDGVKVWFETSDVQLSPTAESLGSAFLIPAMDNQRRLKLADPVCSYWYDQLPELQRIIHRWWGYAPLVPLAHVQSEATTPVADGVGLCFTGGVDSFHSLLHCDLPIDTLIYALDYDVPPQDRQRRSEFEHPFRELCAKLGMRAVVVRSNLRQHPAFFGTSWKQTHGAALVAIGHLLQEVIGTLVVSSSFSLQHDQPWGSHWDLDGRWSSSRLKVVHFGERLRRFDKVHEIVDHPLVQKLVRPCWENTPGMLNCSACEKCVRTMLSITCWGDLDRFSAFDQSKTLVERLDRVRKIPNSDLLGVYQDFLEFELPADVEKAVRRLMRRSRWSVVRKQVRRTVGELFAFAR